VHSEKLAEIARQLLGPLGWHGVAQLDFRWNGRHDSPALLLEVNPRFWGGLFQSVESGIDFPWLLYQMTVEGDCEQPAPARIGTRTKMPGMGLIAAVEEVAESDEAIRGLGDAWRRSWRQLKDGQVGEALLGMVDALTGYLDPTSRIEAINRWIRESRTAKTELLSSDDPLAPLGILYVLGSLLRSGKLPEELKRPPRVDSRRGAREGGRS
jgi:hypothetical protein